jgi:NlpC/P60 family putative phage cell wall peptidase
MSELELRIVAEARRWIGTPYRHQASARGEGADCLGLVRGIWRSLHGAEPETLPHYTADWAERGGSETLLQAAQTHLFPIAITAAGSGDVILFRFAPDCPAKHCAVLSGPETMIHAWQGRSVCETGLGRWWLRRRCAVFRFPAPLTGHFHG